MFLDKNQYKNTTIYVLYDVAVRHIKVDFLIKK